MLLAGLSNVRGAVRGKLEGRPQRSHLLLGGGRDVSVGDTTGPHAQIDTKAKSC